MADGTGLGGDAEDVLPPLNWTRYATNTPLRDSKYGESTPAAKVNFRTIDGELAVRRHHTVWLILTLL